VQANFDSIASASVQLRVANAVMLTRSDGAVSADYLAVLRRDFAAELLRGADLETVNAWVQKKTNGKIDSILDRLDPATLLVLIDAVYFKARWDRAFDVKVTDHQIFHLPAGTAEVPMMHAHDNFALAERPGYRAIRLPYAGKRLAMIVVLPDAGMADVVRLLDDGEMRLLRAALHASNHSVDLSLPRFRAGFKASLVGPFAAMGMHRAFDPRTADFSGMTGKPQSQLPLTIGEIMHRAVIEVAEEGTEAAAATSATMAIAGRPAPPETFRVDRPFLFAIVDEETGAVLFQGRIVDPRQSS
jgi:serpin B